MLGAPSWIPSTFRLGRASDRENNAWQRAPTFRRDMIIAWRWRQLLVEGPARQMLRRILSGLAAGGRLVDEKVFLFVRCTSIYVWGMGTIFSRRER